MKSGVGAVIYGEGSPKSRRGLVLSTVVFLVVGAPFQESWAVSADVSAKVDQLHLEGVTLYKAGKYREAARKFDVAYELYPDPKLLYNKARCYQALGELDDSLVAYRRCAADPEAAASLRKKAQRRIRSLEEIKRRRAIEALRSTRERDAARNQPRGTNTSVLRPGRRDNSADLHDRSFTGRHLLKIATAVVGAGLIIGGTTSIFLGVSDQNKVDENKDIVSPLTLVEAKDLQSSANRKKVIGYSLIALGAASAITSAVLIALDLRNPPHRRQGASYRSVPRRGAWTFGLAPVMSEAGSAGGQFWLTSSF